MTVRKKITKKKITKKRSNPKLWDYITGAKKSTIEPGAYSFKVKDGIIILRGEKVTSSLSEIDGMFSSKLKNLQIEFEPYNTGKRYTLNKEESSRASDDDDETTTEGRFERMQRQAAIRSRLGKK